MEMTTIIQTAINKRLNAVDQLCLPIIKSSIESASAMISNAYLNDGKVITAGNGGSASMSMHFSAELNGRYNDNRNPRRAISLCADMATVTCIANDFGYERIFSRQIESLADKGDVFVAFTTSGKSRNIIEALCQCRAMGVSTISIVGKADDNISKLSDLVIEIPDDNTSIVQEFHLQIVHIIAEIVESMAKEPRDAWVKALSLADEGYHCLLLDRDGVVSRAKANGYVSCEADMVLTEDFVSYARILSQAFKYIFIVSNQKGVGKGLMTIQQLEDVNRYMIGLVEQAGGRIDKVYCYTGKDPDNEMCKPNGGMAKQIMNDFPDIDFSHAVMIGDSASDQFFAENINCKFLYVSTR